MANDKHYQAVMLYESLVKFHQEVHEAKKSFTPEEVSEFIGLDFEKLFAQSKKLADIDYKNEVGFGARKRTATAGENESENDF